MYRLTVRIAEIKVRLTVPTQDALPLDRIYQHYGHLQRAANNARYLVSAACFDDFLTPEQVVNLLLKHHLRQIEKSAIEKFLTKPCKLVGIETAFAPPAPSVST